tara:strand:+ start:1201 stop:3390 length:2190 start_codon:yes stop_codon:yes gene_type:complete
MPLVNFANLDFDQIKVTIKDYLRSNSDFTDYDFEGSNLSTIVDVLAYNTYITSYNANMVSNEVFLDSATLRENVVSLIQNVGYLPRSRRASRINVSFYVDTGGYATQPQTIKLNKGLVATTTEFTNESFTFNILDDIVKPVFNRRAVFTDAELIEGNYINTTFTVDSYDPNQRFVLPNSGVDTTTIRVTVKPSQFSSTSRQYAQTGNVTSCQGHYTTNQSLFEVNGTSAVYWIREIEGERYELIFGDGIFGKKLEAPSYIEVSYIVTNGKDGNGINSLTFNGKITSGRGNLPLTSGISLLNVGGSNQGAGGGAGGGTGGGTGGGGGSYGGADIESIDSIKKYGPRAHGSQNRAVTANDYETLIPTVFPETEAVSCFGGEELTPPRFGQVFCAVKPTNGSYLSNALKENLKNAVKKYNVAGINLDITDLKYLYIEPDVSVYYNCNLGKSKNDIISTVMNSILEYLQGDDIGKFNGRFKFSKFQCLIDGADEAISSNITSLRIRRDLRVALNSFAEYEICFGNCIFVKKCDGHNIRSTAFKVSGIQGDVYLSDKPNSNDSSKGTIFLFRLMSPTQPEIVKQNIGTIDYEHGEIKLAPINITDTDVKRDFPVIEIDGVPCSNDVLGLKDLYLQLGGNNGNGGDGDGSNDGINVDAFCDDTDNVASTYGGNILVRGEVHYGCNTDGMVADTSSGGAAIESINSIQTGGGGMTAGGGGTTGGGGGAAGGGGGGY